MRDLFRANAYFSGLNLPVSNIKDVGRKRASVLKSINIEFLGDFLFHFPKRYEDRRRIKPAAETISGNQEVISGTVIELKEKKKKKLHILTAKLSDGMNYFNAVWFNQPFVKKKIRTGDKLVIVGKCQSRYGMIEIVVSEFDKDGVDGTTAGRIIPVYTGIGELSQKFFRRLTFAAVQLLNGESGEGFEILPEALRKKYSLIGFREALTNIHYPEDDKKLADAGKRLIFEECFWYHLCLLHSKNMFKQNLKAVKHSKKNKYREAILSSLEFTLTEEQQKVIDEIESDMEKERPMKRLLQGEVGSGKTLAAVFAMLKAVSGGYQCAFMVPTEILAEQHYINLKELLRPLKIEVKLLTGSTNGGDKEEILKQLLDKQIDILIGTQALIYEWVKFCALGLVVIDEQHRFGVRQRTSWYSFDSVPDVLVMSATPIPRSLALTAYSDLDLSVMKQLPPGRKEVDTYYVPNNKKMEMYGFIKEKLNKGRQAYIVCPLIEESESLEAAAAEKYFEELRKGEFSKYRIRLLHGKQKTADRERIMNEFKLGAIDILVCTSVIEVGIDVENAAIIVIEGVERFGLAQLHQLRGRVGRGEHKSYCFLMGKPKTKESRERIKVMLNNNDGFKIAEEDLRIRGPGEIFGTMQHGYPHFIIADLERDAEVMKSTLKEAKNIIYGNKGKYNHDKKNILEISRNVISKFGAN